MSTGLRYTTLPSHLGSPLTMTLTLAPLMGHLSTTYAIQAGSNASFCSRFDFNIYSYDSNLVVGCELWRRRKQPAPPPSALKIDTSPAAAEIVDREVAAVEKGIETLVTHLPGAEMMLKKDKRLLDEVQTDDDVTGVLKARWSHQGGVGLLWEGRVKHLLFSLGANVDFRRREGVVSGVGVEVQYSS